MESQPGLSELHREDLRLAASELTGAKRREFQAEITVKYCRGSARLAETVFGWNRGAVEVGLAEKRTGLICAGAQSVCSGSKRWEERYQEMAEALKELAESHAQQDPSFKTTVADTRLTSAEALRQLAAMGYDEETLPAPSTMALVLNRLGYRLRKVVKAKPQKNSRRPMRSSRTSQPKMRKPSTTER
ncbi:MAG: transposase [Cyanobacteria bacterium P01_E01_bin.6]